MSEEFNDIWLSIQKIALEHEEPYRVGAWETFLETKGKKKKKALWPFIISGLAAVLVIGFFIVNPIPYNGASDHNLPKGLLGNEGTVENGPGPTEISPNGSANPKNAEPDTLLPGKKIPVKKSVQYLARDKAHPDAGSIKPDTPQLVDLKKKGNKIPGDDVLPAAVLADSLRETKEAYVLPVNKTWIFETVPPIKAKDRRINLGLSISTLLASNGSGTNLGVSAGVRTDIPLSGPVSINSGLVLAHQKIDNVYNRRVSSGEPASLTSRLFSVDVPLNIKITLNKGKKNESYLLAGISSVGYLSERNTYTYEFEEVVETTTMVGGQEVKAYSTILTQTNVESSEPALSNFDFAGFMNVSYGLKRTFSKNMHLTIAPYVKLPLTGLAGENIRYTGGGISIIISK